MQITLYSLFQLKHEPVFVTEAPAISTPTVNPLSKSPTSFPLVILTQNQYHIGLLSLFICATEHGWMLIALLHHAVYLCGFVVFLHLFIQVFPLICHPFFITHKHTHYSYKMWVLSQARSFIDPRKMPESKLTVVAQWDCTVNINQQEWLIDPLLPDSPPSHHAHLQVPCPCSLRGFVQIWYPLCKCFQTGLRLSRHALRFTPYIRMHLRLRSQKNSTTTRIRVSDRLPRPRKLQQSIMYTKNEKRILAILLKQKISVSFLWHQLQKWWEVQWAIFHWGQGCIFAHTTCPRPPWILIGWSGPFYCSLDDVKWP